MLRHMRSIARIGFGVLFLAAACGGKTSEDPAPDGGEAKRPHTAGGGGASAGGSGGSAGATGPMLCDAVCEKINALPCNEPDCLANCEESRTKHPQCSKQ